MKTYGSIHFHPKKKHFEIDCQPHVAIRLKRVFAKIHTHSGLRGNSTLTLSATPENAFDLKWFIQRYPLEFENTTTETELLGRAIKWSERESLVEKILHMGCVEQEFPMKLPPREYQAQATAMWLAAGGLLLADDVGLGKSAVGVAGMTDPRTRPALVVTLTHLPFQWRDEVAKFTDLECHILKKSTPYDLCNKITGRMPDVVITNYHKLNGWQETLGAICKSVIFDECQELRHRGTKKYIAASYIANKMNFRLGLSATPIYNYGGEIFSVIDALLPDSLGDWAEFQREWCEYDDQKPKIKDTKAFGIYARDAGLMLRRTRKEVGRELPPVTVVPHYIDAAPEVIMKMESDAINLAKIILQQHDAYKGQRMQASGEFDMRMRQATGIAKAPFVAEFVRFLVEQDDEPVILFGWHRAVYDIWMEKLKGDKSRNIRNLNPVLFTGSEDAKEKEISKQKFLRGESKVFVISLRAGAGLDGLQAVSHIGVFGELDWSPGVHEQNIGRFARDGQLDPMTAYYLISTLGSDPFMSDILGVKKQQAEGIRDPNQDLVTKLSVESGFIKKLAAKFLADRGMTPAASVGG
jgi:SNF2 family DNA or RNA helicase